MPHVPVAGERGPPAVLDLRKLRRAAGQREQAGGGLVSWWWLTSKAQPSKGGQTAMLLKSRTNRVAYSSYNTKRAACAPLLHRAAAARLERLGERTVESFVNLFAKCIA